MLISFFMPPDQMIGGILFLSCLFVCLLSTLTFAITFEMSEIETSYICIWHAYFTNDTLSNDIKVNDLVTLTLTLKLKKSFLDFVAAGGIVFHIHTLIFNSFQLY